MADEACSPETTERLIRVILDQIADKWSILIMTALRRGPMRFNALKRDIDGITQKSLTLALRRLERSGIIKRTVIPVSPVAVEYSVTELGGTLVEPFQALFRWAGTHKDDIEEAQRRFDAGYGNTPGDEHPEGLARVG
ncbi:helix-turn-helix transcriptional regulator [Agrobacterium tumefaciens]|uniref:winged helix-turn-helix transcriptional regulator n=1 Tax=Agrobacterium tumefaciens TaxID=358 RepID=UPI0015735077|nr:helix-turn-helix domain-containing protein [Agrobacterium tumefaciens]MCZ7497338.1 helix-turn-helix domain-containing protein [Rhizobium rhizogenes]NTE56552.1 helix-turn-helix transcriptional regulator [Agrobacterium tumefaciens]NTE74520.1 helix-turn-helix transcriptional regulator [Agrobacterium tumefaciens]